MTPRITIDINRDGELELWLNEAGRDLLMRELAQLDERNDHVHLGPEGEGEVPLRLTPYRDGDRVIDWAKILFRTDEWDEADFPHVLDSGKSEL